MKLLRAMLLLAGLCLWVPAIAAEPASADGWRLVSDEDGIRVYRKDTPGSRLKTFRGITEMVVPDYYAIGAVINDYPNIPRWLHFVSAAQEFNRRGPLDRDLLFQTDMPWPVADREAVVRAVGYTPPGTYDTELRFENQPRALPANPDYVRFPQFHARFSFHWLGNRRVQVTYEVVADPGGYIPDFLANRVLRDAPYETLRRFAAVVKRPEYQGHYYDYLVLPPDAVPARRP